MTRFIGREEELQALEAAYQKDSFQMAVIYGRRRIGKTTLLRQFCMDKKAVFFTAIKTTAERNIELFGQSALKALAPSMSMSSFRSFDDLCMFLGNQSHDERVIVVIDELPYLARKEESITSTLQKYIDEQWQFGKMFLIVCGSSVSFMEDEVLSEKSPLFGRRTMQLKLDAFNYRQTALFLPSWSAHDQAIAYGLTGGIAKYITLFDENLSLDDNIVSLFFSKSGYLYEEADNLLTQEFRDVDGYSRIIETIAAGSNQIQEIADKSDISAQNVAHSLKNLMETGIVERQQAITEEHNKKKTRYILTDEMLHFWYRFIPEAMNAIEIGKGQLYYQHNVKPQISSFMGSVFEKMCRQYTLEAGITGAFPCTVTQIGTWWGTNPENHEQTDIDVVGLDKTRKEAVIGECKFRHEITDKKVYDALKGRHHLLHGGYRVVQYLLFSASEFSDWVINEARNGTAKLIRLEEMY
nr:ATP-binding protein [Clostridia bacterium]